MLQGKKIILGVTGSIAAYKTPLIVREFIKAGAEVKVICTPAAFEFVTPLTLSTLSKNPVYSNFSKSSDGTWNSHVDLGSWADLLLIAPVSANTLAKMANGVCDNLLIATYLSSRCKVMIAPAMDLDMYAHPTTKENITKLQKHGNILLKPGNGELASGLIGEGRMAEPVELFNAVVDYFKISQSLKGKNVLVTAGPTYEAIDPVRFIGNHSSGKMGYAIAEELAQRGAKVTLVSGPTTIQNHNINIKRIDVISAEDMYKACVSHFENADAAILSAAVADYKPLKVAKHKIKKKDSGNSLDLELTKDILSSLGKVKTENQVLVGFALETDNEIENAKEKLVKKNLDFIVLNKLGVEGAGFKIDTNIISIIEKNNKITDFELKSKDKVASDIVDNLEKYIKNIPHTVS